ncbi:MAG: sec-independent protein translocase protein TatA [Baekduia sp.]|jgi:sec-independent protein translocase protein TatA|nr:sec-independent protein translocase protein TatA [Baekduia sp.]
MPNIGPMELIVVLVIALVILGPKKLPDVGRSVGRGMREFKTAITGGGDEETDTHLALARAEEPAPVAVKTATPAA